MRNLFCLRKLSWSHTPFLRVCVIALISIPFRGQCSKGDMFNKNHTHVNISSPSDNIELAVLSNSLVSNESVETDQNNRTVKHNGKDSDEEAQSVKPMTDSSNMDSVENSLIPEPDYESARTTASSHDSAEKASLESAEQERGHVAIPSSTSEMESLDDEEETSSKSIITDNAYDDEYEFEITPIPYTSYAGEAKYIKRSSIPSVPEASTVATTVPTKGTTRGKYFILKRVPSRLVASTTTEPITTTKRPKKVIRSTTTKKLIQKVTKASRPVTPIPKHEYYERDPHHPHGVVVFDKRKKRPKPGREKTKPTTTSTTTTTATTTTAPTTTTTTTSSTTSSSPVESAEYYEYYWGSGESSESAEVNGTNSTDKTNSTSNETRIPLSKLAMAMIASSTVFENGTISTGEDVYYPKTPVNLLNILQSYTKQMADGESEQSTVKQPVVQIQSTPFMLQLSQLPFGTRIAISVYYSLIAIIPLIYLAFGGLGRLGFFNAIAGRGVGGRRRRRRSYDGDQYQYGDRYQTAVLQRSDLNGQNEDEYMWILGRISEIILEFSLRLDETEN